MPFTFLGAFRQRATARSLLQAVLPPSRMEAVAALSAAVETWVDSGQVAPPSADACAVAEARSNQVQPLLALCKGGAVGDYWLGQVSERCLWLGPDGGVHVAGAVRRAGAPRGVQRAVAEPRVGMWAAPWFAAMTPLTPQQSSGLMVLCASPSSTVHLVLAAMADSFARLLENVDGCSALFAVQADALMVSFCGQVADVAAERVFG